LIGNTFWIGGSDRQKEGTFVWEKTGKQLVFADWQTGEPNNCCGGQDCMWIDDRYKFKWDDGFCDRQANFICQMSTK